MPVSEGDSDSTTANANSATGPLAFGDLDLKFGAKTFYNAPKRSLFEIIAWAAVAIVALVMWRRGKK